MTLNGVTWAVIGLLLLVVGMQISSAIAAPHVGSHTTVRMGCEIPAGPLPPANDQFCRVHGYPGAAEYHIEVCCTDAAWCAQNCTICGVTFTTSVLIYMESDDGLLTPPPFSDGPYTMHSCQQCNSWKQTWMAAEGFRIIEVKNTVSSNCICCDEEDEVTFSGFSDTFEDVSIEENTGS